MADIPELTKTFRITYYLGTAIVVLLIMGTWVGAEIYFEFQHVKRELIRVESRMDKKTGRNADSIEELQEPNSDESK